MKNTNNHNENINTMARTALGIVGATMLVAFYSAATAGGVLGAGVYLGILSIIPITMAITGWRLLGNESKEPTKLAFSPAS